MRKLVTFFVLACLAQMCAFATSVAFQTTLTIDLTGTKNSNPISDVVIFASNGTQSGFQFGSNLAASGQTVLTPRFAFNPTSMLLIGMEGPAASPTCLGDGTVCNGNDNGNHVLFLVNNAFASAMSGQHFSVAFGLNGYHETTVLQNLLDATTGSTAAQSYLLSFFQSTDGQAAAFNPGDGFTALEFYIGTPVGTGSSTGTPEPSTFVLLGVGMTVAALRNRLTKFGV